MDPTQKLRRTRGPLGGPSNEKRVLRIAAEIVSVDPGPRRNCVVDTFCVRTRNAKSFGPVVIKIRWTLGGPDGPLWVQKLFCVGGGGPEDPIDAITVFMYKVS